MQPEQPSGISAVIVANDDIDRAVLDLAAVLDGLAPGRFEIIVLGPTPAGVSELLGRAPRLPVRSVSNIAEPRYDLVFVAARDGRFDVRELNHLMEASEDGADVAAGYRPRCTDALVRRLQRWGCHVDLDCAFALLRRPVWQQLTQDGRRRLAIAELPSTARREGFRVAEVAVSQRRPTMGVTISASTRAA